MKPLIIYAHPDTKGHCKEILKEVQKKVNWEVLDLYKMKYDPILHENELYTAGKHKVSKENQEIQAKIKKAKRLVFIYPNWWNSMPAILKGFIDKVFVSHFGFEYRNKRPVGLLKGKKAVVFITSGTPRIFSFLFEGNRCQKIMVHDILGFCGIKAKAFIVDNADDLNEKQKDKIKKIVDKGLKWLI